MTPMAREYFPTSQRSRETVIAVVMIGVLTMSAAAAWWLGSVRRVKSHEAASILAEIRDKGLSAFWGDPDPQWFLIRENGKTVGWYARISVRLPDEGYAALEAQIVHAGRRWSGYWEKWSINSNATRCRYASGKAFAVRGSGAVVALDTTIDYGRGAVTVEQFLDRNDVDPDHRGGKDDVPGNYLPEGVFDLAALLVARRKTTARFGMIINQRPFTDSHALVPFVFSYDGPADEKKFGKDTYRVKVSYAENSDVYILDKSGRRLAKFSSGGERVEIAATVENVLDSYPDAVKILDFIRQQTQPLAVYESGENAIRR